MDFLVQALLLLTPGCFAFFVSGSAVEREGGSGQPIHLSIHSFIHQIQKNLVLDTPVVAESTVSCQTSSKAIRISCSLGHAE